MSNRLTFSLASLILIFAMVFAPTAVMAAAGGPTVTITQGTSKTRAAFDLKFTFDVDVTGFAAAGTATWQYYGKAGTPLGSATNITPLAVENKPKEYTAQLDLSSPETGAVGIIVLVPADGGTTGNNALSPKHGLGNQAKTQRFDLPPEYLGKIVIKAVEDTGDTDATDGQMYNLTFTFSERTAPTPALTGAGITIEPDWVDTEITDFAAKSNLLASDFYAYTAKINHPAGAPDLTIGVVPSYVAAANVTTAMIPPAAKVFPAPPTVTITIVDGSLDEGERTFQIDVMFTPQPKSDESAGDPVEVETGEQGFIKKIKATFGTGDDKENAMLTVENEQSSNNRYRAIIQYGFFDELPLTLSIDPNDVVDDSKPNVDPVMAMVGEAAEGEEEEDEPATAEIAVSRVDTDARTFKVAVTLTPGMKADGTAGDAITGFGLSDLEFTGANDSTVTITAEDEQPKDNSYVALLKWNPLAELPVTIKAVREMDGDDKVYYKDTSDPTMDAMAKVTSDGTQPVDPTDQTAPTVTVAAPTTPGDDGRLTFTVTFSEALMASGDYAFGAEDIDITGQHATQDVIFSDTPDNIVFMVSFVPVDMYTDATVAIASDAMIQDAAGNDLNTAAPSVTTDTYEAPDRPGGDNQAPTVLIHINSTDHVQIPANSGQQHRLEGPYERGGDAYADFTLDFSEPMHLPPSASRVDRDDVHIEVFNESGSEIPFTWTLSGARPSTRPASTGLLGEYRELYDIRVTVDQADVPLIPLGYEQPPLEMFVTLRRANVQSARNERLVADEDVVFDTIPPHVKITAGYSNARGLNFVAAKPVSGESGKFMGEPKDKLAFKFEFTEPLSPSFSPTDIHRSVSGDNFELLRDSGPFKMQSSYPGPLRGEDPREVQTYIVVASVINRNMPTTVLIKKQEVADVARNRSITDVRATYEPVKTIPVAKIEATAPFECGPDGNRVKVTITDSEALKTGEVIAESEITVSTGWEIKTGSFNASRATAGATTVTATFDVIRNNVDRNWIGVPEVTITVAADAVLDATDQGNAAAPETYTVGPVLEIPAGGYIVVVRDQAMGRTHLQYLHTLYVGDPRVGSADVSVQTWDCMPDLGVLLGRSNHTYADNRGGTLVVEGGGGLIVKQSADHVADPNVTGSGTIGPGTVGITEIMWAIDRSKYFGRTRNYLHAQEQWIELHNLNNFDVKVTLFDLIRDEAFSNNDYGEIDRMTNFNLSQYHGSWPIRDVGDNKDGRGQDGDSDYGEDFIAMQRGPANLDKNYSHGDFDGRNGGKWTKATAVYLTRRADLANTGQLAFENLNYDFIGTPGRPNNIGPPGASVVTSPSPVPLKPFVINEVGNRDNRLYDWIEIRNTSGAEANLRNYNISIVTGVDKDESLFNFPNSDIKIAKDGVILVLASDPEDDGEHPIAVGHDVLGGTDQVLGLGDNPAKYIVAKRDERLYTGGLPASNFVLILRHTEGVDIAKPETYNGSHDKANSAKAKVGTHERIVDIAGYHDSLGDRNASPKFTALWPLNGHGAPFSKNDLKSEGVYFRRDPGRIHGENNNDKPAFVSQGYTGVGYRRHASNSPVHGGTPGYNDIRKNLVADVKSADDSTGIVTISEIMFDQGDGRYPQWIELYNSSPTNAVNLHADSGWRLEIRNFDDNVIPFARVSGTLNFKDSEVQTILPQQTVLIASTRARSIGSDTINASVVFIPTRVFSVWSEKPARDALGMTRSTDPILSEEAFYLRLIDGKGNQADEAGNLTRRRARGEASYWEWSDVRGETEMDGRSSVIRRYREPEMAVRPERWGRYSDDEILEMGIEAEGWVSAAKTEFRRVERTWYGDVDDYGTPGTTKGRPLPVSLSKFRPERMKDTGEIVVRWVTESELNNAGFNILRSEKRDGEFTKVHFRAGQGTTSERTSYEWKDKTAKPNVVYYYQIQDISLDGEVTTLRVTHLRGNVTATGKLTTTWGEIKALQ